MTSEFKYAIKMYLRMFVAIEAVTFLIAVTTPGWNDMSILRFLAGSALCYNLLAVPALFAVKYQIARLKKLHEALPGHEILKPKRLWIRSAKSSDLRIGDWMALKPGWQDSKMPSIGRVTDIYSSKYQVDHQPGNAYAPIPLDYELMKMIADKVVTRMGKKTCHVCASMGGMEMVDWGEGFCIWISGAMVPVGYLHELCWLMDMSRRHTVLADREKTYKILLKWRAQHVFKQED